MINDNHQNDNLIDIENKLAISIRSEGKSWKIAYQLVKKVESERLWENAAYKSFSEWVRHLASEYSISEMSVWKIKSAGDTYSKYEESAYKKGNYAKPLSECKLAIDTIISLSKMGQGNQDRIDSLINYAQNHELSRRDIATAWSTTRRLIEKAGVEAVRTNSYGKYNPLPPGVDPLKILEQTAYPQSSSTTVSDRDILFIVHKYLGANVHRSTLENALREYTAIM